jgi:hypothetical protein
VKTNSIKSLLNSPSNLESYLERWKKGIQKYIELQRLSSKKQSEERKAVKRIKSELNDLIDAQAAIQEIAVEIQNKVHEEICTVVSKCLSTVFEDPYNFRIDFVKKRGKTEAVLVFERDGVVLEDPRDSAGGGVIDIAAFALRVACILRSIPPLRRLVILDEPFKHIHLSLRPIALRLLKSLSEETGIQFVVVTHISKKSLEKAGINQVIEVD